MKRFALLLVLLLLFALQWALPLMQVLRGEAMLREGTALRLALQPVDPYDVMRGRYLALSFAESTREHSLPEGMRPGDTLYAVLGADPDGLAHITRLSREPQDSAVAWKIPADTKPGTKVRIDIPLTRFYLPEDDAVRIDESLRWRGDGERPQITASLGVRVKDGAIVAESLWLNGLPYQEWLREYGNQAAKSP